MVGIDLSAELIAIARQGDLNDVIEYIVDDAETLATVDDSRFDLVVCNLALMDIPNLDKAINSVWRILRAGGSFVCSITHPCFEAPHAQWTTAADGTISREVSTYFKEGFWRSTNAEGVRGKVGANHRMLSTYINTLTRSGFVIDRIIEPEPTDEIAKQVPGYRIVPAFMLVRCAV